MWEPWHVQGFSLKSPAFHLLAPVPQQQGQQSTCCLQFSPSPQGHSSAGGECPWSRQGLLGAALKMACSGGGRSIPCMSPGLSWAGMEVGHGVRTGRWALPENHHHHLLWFSWDSGNKELHRKTNVPDVSCPHIIVNSVSFPHFHSCNLPSSLLGHRFSFFLFLTRYSSMLR